MTKTNPLQRLRVIQDHADDWAKGAREAHDVSCEMACAHCCTHLIPTTLPEVMQGLMALISRKGHRPPRNLEARIRNDHNKLLALVKKHDGDSAKIEHDWLRLKRPCVFLSGEKCTIYNDRPIACRTHLVVSDPGLCQKGGDVQAINPEKFVDEHASELRVIARAVGAPTRVAPMQKWLPRAWNMLKRELV